MAVGGSGVAASAWRLVAGGMQIAGGFNGPPVARFHNVAPGAPFPTVTGESPAVVAEGVWEHTE